MTQSRDSTGDRLRALAEHDARGPAPGVTAAAVLRRAQAPAPKHPPLRLPSRWLPAPAALMAGFAALLVALPLVIAGWPSDGTTLDQAVYALATGDPAAIDPALSLLLGGRP